MDTRYLLTISFESYKEPAIKKKGIKVLEQIDKARFDFIKLANDTLSVEERFDFYIFDAHLDISDRKGEVKTNVQFSSVFNTRGTLIKKNYKKDLKKKRNSFKQFITVCFKPELASTSDPSNLFKFFIHIESTKYNFSEK